MKDSSAGYEGRLAIDNREVARILGRIADLLEFNDENPFKLRSYRMASETVEELAEPVAEMVARGGPAELQKIPGIGKSISSQIAEIVQTGGSTYLESITQTTPETVLDLRRVSGIGLKTSQLLYRDFGIKNLEELRAFAEGGGLPSVSGLGEKVIARIKSSLARIESEQGKVRLNDAYELARQIVERLTSREADALQGAEAGRRAEIVGQVRRGREMVDRVEVLAAGDSEQLAAAFTALPQLASARPFPGAKVEAETKAGVAVTLHIASEEEFPVAMVRTTGSAEHVRQLEREAQERGLIFKGFQLASPKAARKTDSKKKAADGQAYSVTSEEKFYETLGLDFIPPELREGAGEIELARKHRLPRLIVREDIRGDFHMHTTWSDGRNSVREMIEAARRVGYDYIAITDHTQSSAIANGNSPEELLEEMKEIDAVAREYADIRVFKGAEVDILSDGSLDMPQEVLDKLDWIVCSIHSGFNQDRQQITDRVTRAMATGYPNVFAHPTGRILGERAPYEIDLVQVIAAAKRYNVRMELNASPYRLDLNSDWLKITAEAGVGIVISTDSHQAHGFEAMRYGIWTARRAGLTKDNVLNTLPLPKLVKELKEKRASRQ